MRRARTFLAGLSVIALAAMLGAQAEHNGPQNAEPDATQADPAVEPSNHCPLITIAKGEHSGWSHDNPDFSGADLIIRGREAWEAFWRVHAGEDVRPPHVDFRRHVVIVAVQGLQGSGGGPNIAIVELRHGGRLSEVVIIDDERPGPLDVITNPFHIVATRRDCLPPRGSVVFQHLRPLPEMGVVVGRVFAATPDDVPVPLPGSHLTLASENGEAFHAMSGLDGSYFFVNVPPGDHMLFAEHPRFEPAETPLFVPPNALVAHDFHLVPLPPGAIVGLVLGQTSSGVPKPLGGALVQVFHEGVEVARRITHDDGSFLFDEVPPAVYRVVASAEGYERQAFEAEVEPGGVVEHVFVLQPATEPPGVFAGLVVAQLGPVYRVPVPGALVRLISPDGEIQRTYTNHRGMFVMRGVPPGFYTATAQALGWPAAEAEVEILPGETTEHVFVLRQP